ncbi:MAG: hypothetical protein FWD57_09680, partial [Polyangiaceae bacterium]|nr:hypothetical protein [Polyangiaceae bacterium]
MKTATRNERERTGSFYTPRIWVELSQEYIADALGDDWLNEYTVWDCAAGTGNLLVGLVNTGNVWASTLDKSDVDVMKDRIGNCLNILEDHVFQFDFLNDDFAKLPGGLGGIIGDELRREKLLFYINPPYAEAMNRRNTKNGKIHVNRTAIEKKYSDSMGKSVRELFAQFMTRINMEIPSCKLAMFSTPKFVSSPNFAVFRRMFRARFKKGFVVRANTFDHVQGDFPIAFTIWDLGDKAALTSIKCDVIDRGVSGLQEKRFYAPNDATKTINDWLKQYSERYGRPEIAAMCCIGNDFQHNNFV